MALDMKLVLSGGSSGGTAHVVNGNTILVIGATGMLGRPVAQRLVSDGWRVRGLTRDTRRATERFGSDHEWVPGDVRDPGALLKAMDGCFGVHVNLRGTTPREAVDIEVGGALAIAKTVSKAGVRRVTYLSGAGIEAANSELLPARIKQAAEAAIRSSSSGWTILRASHFMESLDLFVRGRSAAILGRQPLAFHYLAADDYAGQVAAAFRNDGSAHRAITLLGPEAFTMEQALSRYLAIARPGVDLRRIPLIVPRLIAKLTRNRELEMVVRLFDAFPRIPETGDGAEAEQLLGPATTTLDEWCKRPRLA